jgi:hypothetical protein
LKACDVLKRLVLTALVLYARILSVVIMPHADIGAHYPFFLLQAKKPLISLCRRTRSRIGAKIT